MREPQLPVETEFPAQQRCGPWWLSLVEPQKGQDHTSTSYEQERFYALRPADSSSPWGQGEEQDEAACRCKTEEIYS